MKDINRAIELAKRSLEARLEQVELHRDLVISLELQQAWPDLFDDTNGVSFAGYSSGSIVFNTSDGSSTSRPLSEAPESYLKILRTSSSCQPKQFFNPANSELLKRKRAAKEEAKQ